MSSLAWTLAGFAIAPSPVLAEHPTRILWDLRYSDSAGSAGLCDLYTPTYDGDQIDVNVDDAVPIRVTGARRPAVVMVHGGGWITGDKWVQADYAKMLSEMGICVLNINYRLAPKNVFPAMVDDVRSALLFVQKHSDALSVDRERIGLCGYSAGAHLSSLVAVMADEPMETRLLSSNWEADDERWRSMPSIHGVCAGGTPSDFRSWPPANRTMAYFLGGSREEVPDNYLGASITAHVSKDDAPMHLIHGETDFIVPYASGQNLLDALRQAGVSAQMTKIEGEGHMVTFRHPETIEAIRTFFQTRFLDRADTEP
ncbi:MAG: alpha/beta hydrolase [Planctomycetota bacterium]